MKKYYHFVAAAAIVCVIVGILLLKTPAQALNNGLALTPPMGWNSWNHFNCGINENIIKRQADAMVSSGLAAAGYQFINLDDCWQGGGSAPFSPDFDKINVAGSDHEAEASNNTLGGNATINSCSACSGGQSVGFIGGSSNGSIQFNNVNASSTGTYTLTISFLNGDASRPAQMSINGGAPGILMFGSSGSFTTVATQTVNVSLNAGSNMIKFFTTASPGRDNNGNILPDMYNFPSGIAALASYIHSKGLKLGVYTDRGLATCAGRMGTQGYETNDARTYASWGVDYVKEDNCNATLDQQTQYTTMRDALAASGRSIVFSLCHWASATWDPFTGNLSRTTDDIQDNWTRVLQNFHLSAPYASYAAPGYWNDPDMLEVGNGGMTATEDQTHMDLWAVAAAPLILGNDLTSMSSTTLNILTNSEVLAIDQDIDGHQGTQVGSPGTGLENWARVLHGGDRAVVLLNSNPSSANITVNWSDLGLSGTFSVRDVVNKVNRGNFTGSYTANNVPSHGAVMIRISSGNGTDAYEAESSANTLSGGTVASSCSACSGGSKVGFVGNNSGTLQFNDLNVAGTGSYTLTVYYTNGDSSRSSTMSVNNGIGTALTFPGTGSFNTVGSITTTVNLHGGSNTIKFYNPTSGSWSPDFDRIVISGGIITSTATPTFVPPTMTPVPGNLFSTGLESGQTQPTWTNTVEPTNGGLNNIGGICCGLTAPELGTRTVTAHTGTVVLMYSGLDNSATSSYAYMEVFNVGTGTLSSTSKLSYWIYPQSSATSNLVSGSNSSCVAIDIIFTDNSNLRDSGVTDQNGNKVHPTSQCGHLTMDAWNNVTANLGSLSGKTIARINIGYDQPANTGGYRGYIDDISISK